MPYYVYAVKPMAQLEQLAQFDAFKQASTHAKALRAAQTGAPQARIKVMFADNAVALVGGRSAPRTQRSWHVNVLRRQRDGSWLIWKRMWGDLR